MNILIAGGGTGGHLYPGIALARGFVARDAKTQILFVGTNRGIGGAPTTQQGFPFETVTASGFIGLGIRARLKSLAALPIGFLQSFRILKRFRPQLVIGIGGYVAIPVLFAATLLGIKRLILEPNVIPGLVNKITAPLCHLVVTHFSASRHHLRSRYIQELGIPVRPEIIQAATEKQKSQNTLLILGGSQGAHSINLAVCEALLLLKNKIGALSIIHQCGKRDFETVKAAYAAAGVEATIHPFIEDMAETYKKAKFVIARAGAGTLSELGIMGLPSLLIPFPHAGGHQIANAEAFVNVGAADMLLDQDLSGLTLSERVLNHLKHQSALQEMANAAQQQGRPDAVQSIIEAALALLPKTGQTR